MGTALATTARLVAKVAVALKGGVRTVGTRVTARIATYIAVSAGVTRRLVAACRVRGKTQLFANKIC